MRKICMLALIACGLVLAGGLVARGQGEAPPAATPEGGTPRPTEMDDKTRDAIDKGMKFLASIQDRSTGGFGDQNKLVATSLAGMAFLSGGNLPGRGLYGKNVEDAVNFILTNAVMPTGYLQFQMSNMYTHGFTALFLAEAYGTLPPYTKLEPRVRKALGKAIELLEKCQNPEGGWWYEPQKNSGGQGADISVTVCETNALRAARNCGIAVDKRVIEKALKCVKAAANPGGGFSYRVYAGRGGDGQSAFARSAGAVCILEALGAYKEKETKAGLKYLVDNGLPKQGGVQLQFAGSYLYYASYYASQAMFMAGKSYWDKWWPFIRDVLVGQQQPDGSWPPGEGQNKAYSAGISLIVLQMPFRYLPIYQEGVENEETEQPAQ